MVSFVKVLFISDYCNCKKVKVKVEVCSLALKQKYSHNFTELSPGQWTCCHRYHFNSLGSIQTSCLFGLLFQLSQFLHCPTKYPFVLLGKQRQAGKSTLPMGTRNTTQHLELNPRPSGSKSNTLTTGSCPKSNHFLNVLQKRFRLLPLPVYCVYVYVCVVVTHGLPICAIGW